MYLINTHYVGNHKFRGSQNNDISFFHPKSCCFINFIINFINVFGENSLILHPQK